MTENSTITNTHYLAGGFQYKDSNLQFFPHAEGYVNASLVDYNCPTCKGVKIVAYNYVFHYTDHLGNIRLSYGVDPNTLGLKIIEENHYYAFGLKHTNYNSDVSLFTKNFSGDVTLMKFGESAVEYASNQYKYNGKELQTELGLNMYDYGARNYDPALGRWMNIDPLAENSRRWSQYNYCYNNPIFFIDPDGRQSEGTKYVDEESEAKIRETTKKWWENRRNVIIYIYHPSELAERKSIFEGRTGWDSPIYAKDISTALTELNKIYEDGSIDNLLILSHGNRDGIAIGDYDKDDKVRTLVDSDNLPAYIHYSSESEYLEAGYSKLMHSSIQSLSKISNKVKINGNIIFESCSVARNEYMTNNIVNLMGGSNYNFFFNVGLGGLTGENRNDSIRHNNLNNQKVLMYKNGNKSYISDLIINNNNDEPISIVE